MHNCLLCVGRFKDIAIHYNGLNIYIYRERDNCSQFAIYHLKKT